METIKKIFTRVKQIILILVLLSMGGCSLCVAGESYSVEDASSGEWIDVPAHSSTVVLIWRLVGIALLIAAVAYFYFKFMKPTQCKECKRFFVLKKIDTTMVGKKDISVQVENDRRDSRGNFIGTEEQYIPGQRVTYRVKYVCRRCGANNYKSYSKDYANI